MTGADRRSELHDGLACAMPGVGFEPTSSCERRLLRPLPLPIWAPGPGVGSYPEPLGRRGVHPGTPSRSARTRHESRANSRIAHHAGVVELVDTPALGAGGRKPLGVQVPPPACVRFHLQNRIFLEDDPAGFLVPSRRPCSQCVFPRCRQDRHPGGPRERDIGGLCRDRRVGLRQPRLVAPSMPFVRELP